MVARIQAEVRSGDLQPAAAREYLFTLSSLHSAVLEEIRQADAAYAEVLLRYLDGEEAANRAKIRAETTPEFARKQEARNTREAVKEMTAALKYFIRSLSDEMQLQR